MSLLTEQPQETSANTGRLSKEEKTTKKYLCFLSGAWEIW